MKSIQANLEKFKLLISGLVDDDYFNKKVLEIRKKLNIPSEGILTSQDSKAWSERLIVESDKVIESKEWHQKLRSLDRNDPNFKKKNREIHAEVLVNLLKYSVEDLIAENADLDGSFENIINEHIVYGSKMMPLLGNYKIVVIEKNNKKIPTIEVYKELTTAELIQAMRIIKIFNKYDHFFTEVKPLKSIDQDIEIKKLTSKKGTQLKSNTPDFESDEVFKDESIISAIFPEEIDTNDKLKTNKALIRKRRSLLDKRIKEHFPNTYKKHSVKDR